MKTIVIFDNVDELLFFILEGNYLHLDGVFINDDDGSESLIDELKSEIFNDDWSFKNKSYSKFPFFAVSEDCVGVIVTGIVL